ARAYAQCSAVPARRQACQAAAAVGLGPGLGAAALLADLTQRRRFAERCAEDALALLRQVRANGYTHAVWWGIGLDLAPLTGRPEFAEMLRAASPERRYTCALHSRRDREAAELHGLGPEAHLARCRELAAQGYRPVGLAVLAAGKGETAASVWHRPHL